ncbi:hypothetical protein CPB86DRAFT_790521 [Serendipita vermifera]|nr:hypothetical protein CPB86DRAFT_790521 [Serendipita vermifera]
MGRTHNSTLPPLPIEIWWMILDEVIRAPLYLGTTYQGDNWFEHAGLDMQSWENIDWREAEIERECIGEVCKMWQTFSQSRKARSLGLTRSKTGELLYNINEISKATRVNLISKNTGQPLDFSVRTMGWEIVVLSDAQIKTLANIRRPYLRRLILKNMTGNPESFDPNALLLSLRPFTSITWLEYYWHPTQSRHVPMMEGAKPLELPSLQVLVCHFVSPVYFPFQHLLLPSLQHLSISSGTRIRRNSLSQFLEKVMPYRQTLRSIYFYEEARAHQYRRFPAWSEFLNSKNWSFRTIFNSTLTFFHLHILYEGLW